MLPRQFGRVSRRANGMCHGGMRATSVFSNLFVSRSTSSSTSNSSAAAAAASSSSAAEQAEREYAKGVQMLVSHMKNQQQQQEQDQNDAMQEKEKNCIQYAILHWTNAAELGHVKAQSALGQVYLQDNLVARNEPLARHFLQQAADQGHLQSCHELGKLFFKGTREIQQNIEMALNYWEKAASKGHMASNYDLGMVYYQGMHPLVTKSEAKAMDFFKQAAASGMAEAHHALGKAYLRDQSHEDDQQVDKSKGTKAIRHLRKAAESGFSQAQFDLGACYALGLGGLTKDVPEAAKWFFLAAEAGLAQAQMCLAQILETGHEDVIKKDMEKAIANYRAAASQGLAEAQQALQRLGQSV